MKNVTVGPIKDFVVGIYDGPHATPPESSEGPIFLGIQNVTEEGRLDLSKVRHIAERDFLRWTRRVTPQPGDIVFSYEATLHRYALIPEGFCGCLGRRLALVRPDVSKIHSRFLYYYFLSPNWRAVVESNILSGATVDRIPLKRFPQFEVQIPPLSDQRRIASLFSNYDELIENNRRRIELLEQAARLIYKEWFVDLRFPGHEQVKVIDGVPEGWVKAPLSEIAWLQYGKGLRADDRVPGQYPVYGSSGVIGTHNKSLVSGPTIIVGRKGNVGSIFWSETDCYPIDTVYYIDSAQASLYLYYALDSIEFISTDVAVPGLNRNFAHSRLVLLPPKEVSDQFEMTIAPLQAQVSVLIRHNEVLAQARDLLLPRLMNGEISV